MIELKNISKTYHMGSVDVHALRGVSLKIEPGEFVVIMGSSGSGKSTLMHVIGLLDRPDAGDYYLNGQKVSNLGERELAFTRNRVMGFVFQQFYLLPRMNAVDNVALPLIYGGQLHRKERAEEKMIEVGLGNRLQHRSNELSGGQQQRVAIARALVNEPQLILADEPTGNLDVKSKEEIMALLKELNQKGKTVIIVTHEQEIAQHARRVITIRDGSIISDTAQKPVSFGAGIEKNIIQEDSYFTMARGRAEFFDFAKQAYSAIISHKMRSFLSILGILIGVGAVIAMLALGTGARNSIEKQLSSLGANLLIVHPGSARVHGVSMESGSVLRLTLDDVPAIGKMTDFVKSVAPSVQGRAQLVYGNKNWNTQLEGTSVEYETMRAATPMIGRFFTEQEVRQRAKVVLIGLTVAKELFGENNPVGAQVKINLINFHVIGVLPTKGASGWRDQDDTVVMPITTAMFRVLGKDYLDTIYVEAKSPNLIEQAQDEISSLIKKKHRLVTEEEQDSFDIRNMADLKTALEATTKTLGMLLGAIAIISLIVGGIGIMNIMLVSVTERTREIGLRKALGATSKDILVQFLLESILMSLIGGAFGVGLGVLVSFIMIYIASWTVTISGFSIALATIFSLGVGVVFGSWPAYQASRLNPIEALRFE